MANRRDETSHRRVTRDRSPDADIEASITSGIAGAVSTVLRARGRRQPRRDDCGNLSDRDSDFEDPKPKRT